MSASDFQALNSHVDHDVHVVQYIDSARGGQVVNVAVECINCQTVLLDFDNPAYDDEKTIILTPVGKDVDLWGEDPAYLREDWRLDVGNGDTNLGYWDWVDNRREFDEDAKKFEQRLGIEKQGEQNG